MKISGVRTMAKATLIRFGGTAVPSSSPIAAPAIEPASQTAISPIQLAESRFDAAGEDELAQREDQDRGDDPAQRRDDHLLRAHPDRGKRRQQTIFDLLG